MGMGKLASRNSGNFKLYECFFVVQKTGGKDGTSYKNAPSLLVNTRILNQYPYMNFKNVKNNPTNTNTNMVWLQFMWKINLKIICLFFQYYKLN